MAAAQLDLLRHDRRRIDRQADHGVLMRADQQERIKTVQAALNDYFRTEPTPAEAWEFLQKLQRDIEIMLWAIETKLADQLPKNGR
jgi:hypothetical protein